MKKLLLVILGPFLLVASVTIGIIWWDRGAPPGFEPPMTDVLLSDLSRAHRGVRVRGTAHYELRITQRDAKGTSWYLFPLFPVGDTGGREITAIVRTTTQPDPLLGFEDLTLEGLARPPGRMISGKVVDALLERGYQFSEDFVLIEAFDRSD